MRRTTIKNIAEVAGVSTAAASFALNNKPGVSEETREKVLAAAKELNYVFDENARSLKTKKSGYLGLVVTDIRNPFFSHIVDAFSSLAEEAGYRVLLGISSDKSEKEADFIKVFMSKGVEGIAIVPSIEDDYQVEHLDMLKKLKIPFVLCTTFYEGVEANCVMTDLQGGEEQMIKYLLNQGMRKIFLITASRKLPLSYLRVEGYRRAYAEFGLEFHDEWIFEVFPDFEHGYSITEQIWRDRPDAIVTINDILAMGVLKALQEMGAKVPYDVSVAGYDDLLYSSLIETPLTTVKQPVEEICKATIDILLEKIDHSETGTYSKVLLSPVLKIRRSTK